MTDEGIPMIGESIVVTLAAWIIENVSDPELLIILMVGAAALVGFRVRARIAQIAARDVARPADDLI